MPVNGPSQPVTSIVPADHAGSSSPRSLAPDLSCPSSNLGFPLLSSRIVGHTSPHTASLESLQLALELTLLAISSMFDQQLQWSFT